MCGILVVKGAIGRFAFISMLKDSADRGQDSTGAMVIDHSGEIVYHRALGDVRNWLATCPNHFWDVFDDSVVVLAVTRAQPVAEGDSVRVENRQPIRYGDWIGVHNGTIGNDRELQVEHSFNLQTQIDSEVAIALLDKMWNGTCLSVQSWASHLSGGMAIAAYNVVSHDFVVIKNFKPLCYTNREGNWVWVSERKTLEVFGRGNEFIHWVPPYQGYLRGEFFPIETLHETELPVRDDQKAIVVTSGGIDSTTSAYVASKLHHQDVTLLHFDYGQIAKDREWESVQYAAQDLGAKTMQVDISWLGKLYDSPLVSFDAKLPLGIKSVETTGCWVPARNLVMLSLAAGIAESLGIGNIYSGFNLEESGVYPDNDIEFLKVFNLALSYGTIRRPKLVLALERLMKPEILKLGEHLGVPYDHTWSCDLGGEKACGQCGCCWMRQFAFRKAGIQDGQTYLNPPVEQAPWVNDAQLSPIADIADILRRTKQSGLEDLIKV